MLIDISSMHHASLGPEAKPVSRPTQAQVDEQLQEAIVRPLASLVDVASEGAGIGAGLDSDESDSASDEADAVLVTTDTASQATRVHATGTAAAREADELQTSARITKRALKKLARARLPRWRRTSKTTLHTRLSTCAFPLRARSSTPSFGFNSTAGFFGCFEDPLLVTAMLIDPGNRGLFTADFIEDSQLKKLKDIFAQQLTQHVSARTGPIAVATVYAAPTAEAAGGGVSADVAQPAPKRVLGSVRGAKRVFQPTADAAPDAVSLAAAELARYWTEPDAGDTPTLQWWHLRRGAPRESDAEGARRSQQACCQQESVQG